MKIKNFSVKKNQYTETRNQLIKIFKNNF